MLIFTDLEISKCLSVCKLNTFPYLKLEFWTKICDFGLTKKDILDDIFAVSLTTW